MRFSRLRGWSRLEAVAVLAYLAMQAVWYPVATAINDETAYLGLTYVLRAGTIFADQANISLVLPYIHNGHQSLLYPPGESLLILPATLVHWRLSFAVSILLQLAGYWVFRHVLVRQGLPRPLALTYLFFPPLFLFSRTLMTEVASVLLVTFALWLYLRQGSRDYFLVGLVFGLSLFLRYANFLPFVLLLACAAYRDVRSRRGTGAHAPMGTPLMVAGFLPALAGFIAYNELAYGQATAPGYAALTAFGLRFVPMHLGAYLIGQMLLYPGALLAVFFYRRSHKLEVVVLTWGSVLAMAAFYERTDHHGFLENVVVGTRLVLPATPFLLLGYADALTRLGSWLTARRLAQAGAAAVACLVAVDGGIAYVHQHRLQEADYTRRFLYAHLPPTNNLLVNDEAPKFINPAWGNHLYQLYAFSDLPRSHPTARAGTVVVYSEPVGADQTELRIAEGVVRSSGAREVARSSHGWDLVIWQVP